MNPNSRLARSCDKSFIKFLQGIFSVQKLELVTFTAIASLALSSCGGGDASSLNLAPIAVASSTGNPAPAPTPTPTPAQTLATSSSSVVKAPTTLGAEPMHASFDVQLGLKRSWSTGEIPGLYNQYEGAFRFTCGGNGKLIYDDPLVYPGQPGKSHLHKIWGNEGLDAYSTPEGLIQSADSDCNQTPYSLNRSAYWMPALINDQSETISPDLVSVYYKRKTSASPFCDPNSGQFIGKCIGLPNQIRFVFGWDANNPTANVQGASWYCTKGEGKHYSNLDEVFNSGCTAGAQLIANTIAQNCWDGEHLDVADHRSHMAYGSYGSWGYYRCPSSHPYYIPQEENKVTWTVTADMIGTKSDGSFYSRISLSSDAMLPGAKPGATLHADYIEAWVSEVKDIWQENCIEKALSCSGGDLGNGQQLIGASQPSYGWINPDPRKPIPSRQP